MEPAVIEQARLKAREAVWEAGTASFDTEPFGAALDRLVAFERAEAVVLEAHGEIPVPFTASGTCSACEDLTAAIRAIEEAP